MQLKSIKFEQNISNNFRKLKLLIIRKDKFKFTKILYS